MNGKYTKWRCSNCQKECKLINDEIVICGISHCPYCGGRNRLAKEVSK
jgi:DNA-directed RNA polymerase subunit RPC12/RpoP